MEGMIRSGLSVACSSTASRGDPSRLRFKRGRRRTTCAACPGNSAVTRLPGPKRLPPRRRRMRRETRCRERLFWSRTIAVCTAGASSSAAADVRGFIASASAADDIAARRVLERLLDFRGQILDRRAESLPPLPPRDRRFQRPRRREVQKTPVLRDRPAHSPKWAARQEEARPAPCSTISSFSSSASTESSSRCEKIRSAISSSSASAADARAVPLPRRLSAGSTGARRLARLVADTLPGILPAERSRPRILPSAASVS